MGFTGGMKRFMIAGLCAFLLLCLAGSAGAVVIDFEGQAPGGNWVNLNPYPEDGFTIFANMNANAIFSATAPSVNSNGTDIYGWCGNCGLMTLKLTQNSSNPFSIQSLDASSLNSSKDEQDGGLPDSLGLNVVGYLNGGGTVNKSFNLTPFSWGTFIFGPEFSHLTAIEISSSAYPSMDLAMDNLVLNGGPSAVPVPPSLLLLGTGLMGLFGFKNKLRK